MNLEKLVDLLQKIYLYYPIGMPQIYKNYPGFKLLQKKIEEKFDGLSDSKDSDWGQIFLIIEREFKSYKVFDRHYQFPNHFIEIELETLNEYGMERKRSIVIVISLLVDCFTVY